MRMISHLTLATLVLGLGASLLMPVAAPAQEAAPAAGEQAQQTPAEDFIQKLGDRAINIVTNKSLTAEERAAKYSELLHNAFDIPTIGHFVLGRAWNMATPDQQREYLKLLESLIIKIYGDKLNFYSGEDFHVKGMRQESEHSFIVSSELTHPRGESPTAVDWHLRETNGTFAILDVVVSGVSQSITQRQEYASILARNSGEIEELLKLMRSQVEKPETAPQHASSNP